MKQTETNEFVAQGAATWQEREEHDRIMKALDNVRGFVDSYFYINGNCYYWSTKPLPEEEALAIAQRGRHDEIMYMMKTTGELFLTDDSPIDIIIKYKPNRSEDTSYLYTLTEDLEDEGYEVICMIQDHVKRLKATTGQTDVRLELGDVVNEMKTFAMIKDIPLITVSHVNREGAKVIDSSSTGNKVDLTRMLGPSFIGESMLMLDNIDFGCILNVEYDSEGNKYMVFKGVKYRIPHELEYVCQPYEEDNSSKLKEDLYREPVYKTTLSPVPTYQNDLHQQLSHSKVKMNGYSSAIQSQPDKNDSNDIFEAIERHKENKVLQFPIKEESKKNVIEYIPMRLIENSSKIM